MGYMSFDHLISDTLSLEVIDRFTALDDFSGHGDCIISGGKEVNERPHRLLSIELTLHCI